MRAFTSVIKVGSRPAARAGLRRATPIPHLSLFRKANNSTPQRPLQHLYTKSITSRAYSTTNIPEVPLLADEDSRKARKEDQEVDNTAGDTPPIFLQVSPADIAKQTQKQKPQDGEENGGKDGSKGGGGEEREESGSFGDEEEDWEFPGLDDFLPDDLDIF